MTNQNAEQLREQAARHDQEAADSFDRCDTDGFVSQWAHGITARQLRAQANIEENGGMSTFPGLFDSQGRRVKAKLVTVYNDYKFEHETKWIVLDGDDKAIHWVARPKNPEQPSARSKMGQLGLHEQDETAPGRAEIGGSGRGLSGAANCFVYTKRTDDGYPTDAVIFGEEN